MDRRYPARLQEEAKAFTRQLRAEALEKITHVPGNEAQLVPNPMLQRKFFTIMKNTVADMAVTENYLEARTLANTLTSIYGPVQVLPPELTRIYEEHAQEVIEYAIDSGKPKSETIFKAMEPLLKFMKSEDRKSKIEARCSEESLEASNYLNSKVPDELGKSAKKRASAAKRASMGKAPMGKKKKVADDDADNDNDKEETMSLKSKGSKASSKKSKASSKKSKGSKSSDGGMSRKGSKQSIGRKGSKQSVGRRGSKGSAKEESSTPLSKKRKKT